MALRNGMSFMGLWLPRVTDSRWEVSPKDETGRAPGVVVYRVGPGSWQIIVTFRTCSLYANGPTKRAAVEKMRRYIRELDEQLGLLSAGRMSYARFGVDGSDVYVYPSNGRFVCCGCATTNDAVSMIRYLESEHVAAGDHVPQRCFDELLEETEK
jgi:hypothetical protein